MRSKSTRVVAAAAALIMVFASAGCSGEKETSETKITGSVQSSGEVQPKEAAEISVDTSQISADDLDVGYEETDSTAITFGESGAEIGGTGAQADGTVVTITKGGTYVLNGSCSNGRIIVNADKSEKVKLVLDGIELGCRSYAPLTVLQADKVTLTLEENSENSFTDAPEYELGQDDNTDAAIFSKADLTINGGGSLTVTANYKHGIVTKDDLVIAGGKITVNSASSALTGKDSVTIAAGEFDLASGTDAIKTSEIEKEGKGVISITGGSFTINSQGDAVSASTDLYISGGEFDITTGEGSASAAQKNSGQFGGGKFGDIQMPDDMQLRGDVPEGEFADGENQFGGRGKFGDIQIPDDMQLPGDVPKGEFADGEMPFGGRGKFGDIQMPDDMQLRGDVPEGEFADGENQFGGRGKFGDIQMPDDMQLRGDVPKGGFADGEMPFGGGRPDDIQTDNDSVSVSQKGIKADGNIVIEGGDFTIDSADDSIHGGANAQIKDGVFELSSGDDGIHIDNELAISGGKITVAKSYEGIEGMTVTISGGDIDVTAADDGINCAGGSDTGNENRMGRDMFAVQEGVYLSISGGNINVSSGGDGLDSNGDLFISGGTIYVSGPENGGNGSLDCNGSASITGGTIIACGAVGMEEMFGENGTTQYAVLHDFTSSFSSGTEVTVTDSSGNTILSFTNPKTWQGVIFSSPELRQGEIYTVSAGGESADITIESLITSNSSGMGFGRMGRGNKMKQNRSDNTEYYNNADMI